jgi:hypothetical protein
MRKLLLGQFAATLALSALVFAPDADAAPDIGDGPGPMADVVRRTLHNDPSVAGVRRMMRNYTGFMVIPAAAWQTILNGVVWNCPQHADSLRQYAMIYGNN